MSDVSNIKDSLWSDENTEAGLPADMKIVQDCFLKSLPIPVASFQEIIEKLVEVPEQCAGELPVYLQSPAVLSAAEIAKQQVPNG